MLILRGVKDDYNQWAEMGNEGWAWNDVLPLFKKVNYLYLLCHVIIENQLFFSPRLSTLWRVLMLIPRHMALKALSIRPYTLSPLLARVYWSLMSIKASLTNQICLSRAKAPVSGTLYELSIKASEPLGDYLTLPLIFTPLLTHRNLSAPTLCITNRRLIWIFC